MMKTGHQRGEDVPDRGRNVIICCDGTGMKEDASTGQSITPSNVKKIFMCVDVDTAAATAAEVRDELDARDAEKRENGHHHGVDASDAGTEPPQGSDDAPTGAGTESFMTANSGDEPDSHDDDTKEKGDRDQKDEPPRHQIAYYERGVGSVGGALSKAGAGMTGYGVSSKIIIMYNWLGIHWREYDDDSGEEDRLYAFGFSRGAFAVRSLMGMIGVVGLLDLRGLTAEEAYRRSYVAFNKGYRKRRDRELWAKGTETFREKDPQPWKFFRGDGEQFPIHFVGVWDTVGQLGMPRETWCLWTLGLMCAFTPQHYNFHETRMNSSVRTARHALAMDEMRSTFQPVFDRARWKAAGSVGIEDSDFKQVWFPGAHGNVGGGLTDTGLSDVALKWMVDEAREKGLRFQQNMVDQIKPNPRGDIYYTHGVSIYKNLTHFPRSVPAIIPENAEGVSTNKIDLVHSSAIERSRNPPINDAPYFPNRALAPGDSTTALIRADKVYNSTYVYLAPGTTWKFTADGRWTGVKQLCGPEGYPDNVFSRPASVNMAVGIGRVQRGFRNLTRNREANLPFTRRHDYFPWFSLMGMIATGAVRDATAKAEFHQIVGIGKGMEYTVGDKGGYLYCYMNDAWGAYTKNKGTVELVIERIK